VLHPNNFTPNGTWKDSTKIISSGPYKLKKLTSRTAVLEKNKDNFNTITFKTVEINFVADLTNVNIQNPSIINTDYEFDSSTHVKIDTIPINLGVVELNPEKNRYFSNYDKRVFYRNNLLKELKKIKDRPVLSTKAIGFYNSNSIKTDQIETKSIKNSERPLIILKPKKFSTQMGQTAYKILLNVLKATNQSFTEKIFSIEAMHAKDYDFAFKMVNIGGSPRSWIIDMMFNSTLGVNFPDPKNKIIELTDKYENSKMTPEEYKIKFDQQVYDSASVVPLFHTGTNWYYSNEINVPEGVKIINYPRFLELDLKMDFNK
jgi:MarR-like DNA-binding transcriptional regulator SgrR of sgrS sRNA